jgi:cytoskeleton protein RodZ
MTAPAEKPPEPTPPPAPFADAEVVLEARGLTWVRLEDAKGATLVAGARHKGWRYTLPAQAGLRLTVDRANQLVVVVGDRALPPLGPAGRAVRNLPLDLARLRRKAAALGR